MKLAYWDEICSFDYFLIVQISTRQIHIKYLGYTPHYYYQKQVYIEEATQNICWFWILHAISSLICCHYEHPKYLILERNGTHVWNSFIGEKEYFLFFVKISSSALFWLTMRPTLWHQFSIFDRAFYISSLAVLISLPIVHTAMSSALLYTQIAV